MAKCGIEEDYPQLAQMTQILVSDSRFRVWNPQDARR
jgi:hypothetical protein